MLHGRRELLEAMPPFLGGGHMISRVGDYESPFAEPPARFEAGHDADRRGDRARRRRRLPRPASAWTRVWEHSRDVTGYAVERLRAVPGLTLHGPAELAHRGSLCSFALEGVHPHDVAEILGRDGVCVRAGHHCAQPLMRRLGVPASSRASFAVHNTREDVDRLIEGLDRVLEVFA